MARGINPRKANGHRRRVLCSRVLARDQSCWICGLPIDRTLPNLHPCQGVVDELTPISRGGSPYQEGNCAGAHRCCNGWRKTKSVETVQMIKRLVLQSGARWQTPQQFVTLAKAAEQAARKQTQTVAFVPPKTTTNW